MNRLSELFKVASGQSEQGWIRLSVFIQWIRASRVIPDTCSTNLIGNCQHILLTRPKSCLLQRMSCRVFWLETSMLASTRRAPIHSIGTGSWSAFVCSHVKFGCRSMSSSRRCSRPMTSHFNDGALKPIKRQKWDPTRERLVCGTLKRYGLTPSSTLPSRRSSGSCCCVHHA